MSEDALRFRFAHYVDRSFDELVGFIRGIVADGHVSDLEAIRLAAWMNGNPVVAQAWPGNVIADRLQRIFADGVIDEEERTELTQLLEELTGGVPIVGEAPEAPTALPLCRPAPTVVYAPGRQFVFTGTFAFGKRSACEAAIAQRGALAGGSVSKKTRYLVIGSVGSKAWVHSTHGRKIEDAVALRDAGSGLNIISEETWVASLS